MSWYENLITSYCIIDADFLFVAPRGKFAFSGRKNYLQAVYKMKQNI